MLFRMAFKTTDDNFLQVTAFAKGLQNLSAIHLNAEVFGTAVKIAGISEPASTELVDAAKEAYLQQGVNVCCELIDLERDQVRTLCLAPNG
jgi:hypothetical protein